MDFTEMAASSAYPSVPRRQQEVRNENGDLASESEDEFYWGPPDRPLERLCPEKLRDADVTEFFPSFRQGAPLRFYELFKPPHRPPRYWSRKSKKKPKEVVEEEAAPVELMEVASKVENDEDLLMRCSEADLVKLKQEKIRKGQLFDLTSPECLALFGAGNDYVEKTGSQIAPWRYGPASLWYDRVGVAPDAKTVNYGFKLKKIDDGEDAEEKIPIHNFPEDTFRMAANYRWEDDIIWTPEQAKEIEAKYERDKSSWSRAGWVPHGHGDSAIRTMCAFYAKYKDQLPGVNSSALLDLLTPKQVDPTSGPTSKPRLIYPIFPPESQELIDGSWENKIIWDGEQMSHLPEPELVQPAPGDDYANLQLPESGESGIEDEDEPIPGQNAPVSPIKGQNNRKKKSKLLLKAGVRDLGSAFDEFDGDQGNPLSGTKSIFNLSNDEYYEGLSSVKALVGRSGVMGVLQHSTPAVEMRPILFPTCLSLTKLRQYHRPMLKRYAQQQQQQQHQNEPGQMSLQNKPLPIYSLTQHMKEQAQLREAERQRSGGGHVFFMRKTSDLSAKDGDICLFEYSEQYPPLISQIGMASKILNYYKRKPEKDREIPECKYGQMVAAGSNLFLGNLQPGQVSIQLVSFLLLAFIPIHYLDDSIRL